jgi:hypothetical protein
MKAPKYEDLLRQELADNKNLSNAERMQILKQLGKLEENKQVNARLRIKARIERKEKDGKDYRLAGLPPARQDEPKRPMGEVVDAALEQYAKEQQDGKSGQQHEHPRQVGHEQERAAGGKPGA